MITFLADTSLTAHFPNLCQNSKIFERELKNGTLFDIKTTIMLMTSSKQGNDYYFKHNCFIQKQHEWLMFP